MKKTLSLLLALILICAPFLTGARAESTEWILPTDIGLTLETFTLFRQATDGLVGILLQPIQLMAIRGTSEQGCCFLCKGFTPDAEPPFYALAYICISKEGKPYLAEIQRLEIGLLPSEADEPVPEALPIGEPTPEPTEEPTPEPTEEPTPEPTAEPTEEPTPEPTPVPTAEPIAEPTEEPTPEPTAEPTEEPTPEPTPVPTAEPTAEPTEEPTPEPTPVPTAEPTAEPAEEPTPEPTEALTPEPTDPMAIFLGEYIDGGNGTDVLLRIEPADTEEAALLTVEWPTGADKGYRYQFLCRFDAETLTFIYEDGEKYYWVETQPGSINQAVIASRLKGCFRASEDGSLLWDASGSLPESNCHFTRK